MRKSILALAILALPAFAHADQTAAMGKPAPVTHKVAAAKESSMELSLNGSTDANRMEIEKLAKQAGADKASLDVKTGVLKISYHKNFNKEKFTSSLSKVQGVTIK